MPGLQQPLPAPPPHLQTPPCTPSPPQQSRPTTSGGAASPWTTPVSGLGRADRLVCCQAVLPGPECAASVCAPVCCSRLAALPVLGSAAVSPQGWAHCSLLFAIPTTCSCDVQRGPAEAQQEEDVQGAPGGRCACQLAASCRCLAAGRSCASHVSILCCPARW